MLNKAHHSTLHTAGISVLVRGLISAAMLALMMASAAQHAAAVTIFITTTELRVTGGPGCSRQEAIWSANLHANLAVEALYSDGPDIFVSTNRMRCRVSLAVHSRSRKPATSRLIPRILTS